MNVGQTIIYACDQIKTAKFEEESQQNTKINKFVHKYK